MFQARREAFMSRMDGGVALFFAAPERNRSADTNYKYRQDSALHYLTGFPEPGSVAVLVPGRQGGRFVMFVRPRDPERETWDGRRAGPEGAKALYGADEAYTLDELPTKLPELFENTARVYYAQHRNPVADAQVRDALAAVGTKVRQGVTAPDTLVDPGTILNEMRLMKSAEELDLMREAARISSLAHIAGMQALKPGVGEHQIEALIEYHFRASGASGPAYNSIVGSGVNATILHYTENKDICRDGDLLLVDAGAESQGYAADITRTYPVSGTFSGPQRDVYDVVLAAQLAAIEEVRQGKPFTAYHDAAVRVLVQGLVELKILSGEVDGLVESGAYRPYYMHRTGHWLGLDVHDAGAYRQDGDWRKLQPGMVLTVEPGLYFGAGTESAPKAFHGIGVRIEDDVLVTSGDPEILTALTPKSVADVEATMAREPVLPLAPIS